MVGVGLEEAREPEAAARREGGLHGDGAEGIVDDWDRGRDISPHQVCRPGGGDTSSSAARGRGRRHGSPSPRSAAGPAKHRHQVPQHAPGAAAHPPDDLEVAEEYGERQGAGDEGARLAEGEGARQGAAARADEVGHARAQARHGAAAQAPADHGGVRLDERDEGGAAARDVVGVEGEGQAEDGADGDGGEGDGEEPGRAGEGVDVGDEELGAAEEDADAVCEAEVAALAGGVEGYPRGEMVVVVLVVVRLREKTFSGGGEGMRPWPHPRG